MSVSVSESLTSALPFDPTHMRLKARPVRHKLLVEALNLLIEKETASRLIWMRGGVV